MSDQPVTTEMVTMMSPAHGQSDRDAFESAMWSTAFMPAEENTSIQRGPAGEAIGHRSVVTW